MADTSHLRKRNATAILDAQTFCYRAFKMRQTLFVIFTFLITSQPLYAQNQGENSLVEFNRFLDKERAQVLQEAVDSFEKFLITNYPNRRDETERIESFLKQIARLNNPSQTWVFDMEANQTIIESFESTGLRKEIWVYGYENYESKHNFSEVLPPPLPADTSGLHVIGDLDLDLIEEEIIPVTRIDPTEQARIQKEHEERFRNSLHSNYEGDYIFALLKFSPKDSFVYQYAQSVQEMGVDISKALLANTFLHENVAYDDPLVKRLLVTEFYYWLLNLK